MAFFFLKGDLIFLFFSDSEGIFLPQNQSQIVVSYYNFSPIAIVYMLSLHSDSLKMMSKEQSSIPVLLWVLFFFFPFFHPWCFLTSSWEKLIQDEFYEKKWSYLGFNNREQERYLFQRIQACSHPAKMHWKVCGFSSGSWTCVFRAKWDFLEWRQEES